MANVNEREFSGEDIPIFAIDFEGSKKIGIVEYGIVKILKGEILECHTRICLPKQKISKKDSDFFNITNAETSDKKPFIDDVEKFRAFRSEGVFASHNSSVEDSLLRAQTPTPGFVPDFFNAQKKSSSWGPWIDTLPLSKTLYPSIKSAGLSDLISALRLENNLNLLAKTHCPANRRKPHCALFDALACALLITHLYKIPEFENLNAAWILQHSNKVEFNQASLF